jgi:hypothetical protein
LTFGLESRRAGNDDVGDMPAGLDDGYAASATATVC